MSSRLLDFAVVVVHYGETVAQTTQLVAALDADDTVPAMVLVDNGPTHHDWRTGDGPVVLATGANLGYGGGANAGIEAAVRMGAADVVVMATDALISPGSLARLVAHGRQVGATITGPRIAYEGGERIWADGIILDETWAIARNRNKGRDLEHTPAPVDVPILTGHVLVLHDPADRPWLRFDDRYFMYYEDVDICERARGEGGHVFLDASTIVEHRKPGDTSYRFGATQQFHMSRSGLIHLRSRPARRASRLAGFLALTAYRTFRSDGLPAAWAAWRGVLAGWRTAPA